MKNMVKHLNIKNRIPRFWLVFFLTVFIGLGLQSAAQVNVQAQTPDWNKQSFQDLEKNADYIGPVAWCVKNGIVTGVSSESFGVGQQCSETQVITFLWRLQQQSSLYRYSLNSAIKEGTDKDAGGYYREALLWAVQQGIISDEREVAFASRNLVTRSQFSVFLYRLAGEPEVATDNPFQDVAESDDFYPAVLWAYENGIIDEVNDSCFEPLSICTKEQAATFLWKYKYLQSIRNDRIDAAQMGLAETNTGEENSSILQNLVDMSSKRGGAVIYIPKGEYIFGEIGTQKLGSHCVKMRSDVVIEGAGEDTILKPSGVSDYGLDMFYFNDYLDYGEPEYLENCRFENFVIDGEDSYCQEYTSAGKGFMINLFKDCYWENVVVKNTVATGFGVDCPIGGTMVNCVAINCGRAARNQSAGASGFGIGFGYSEDEYFSIFDCTAYGNKKFGFFFEHQARFNKMKYQAEQAEGFLVKNCLSYENNYNFGGLYAIDTRYQDCVSKDAISDGFYFENSKRCQIIDSSSASEGRASYALVRSNMDGGTQLVENNVFQSCSGSDSFYGVWMCNYENAGRMKGNKVLDCNFKNITSHVILTEGPMKSLVLNHNDSDSKQAVLSKTIEYLVNENNSWDK